MTEATTPGIAGLLARVDASWERLAAPLARLAAEERLDEPISGGWSAKLVAAHVAAWERSLVALLQGTSRDAALGIPPEIYAEEGIDGANAAIARHAADTPAGVVMAEAERTHSELRRLLAGMSDLDLERPYSHFQPQDPPHNPDPVIGWIDGNTWEHYDEHADAIGAPPGEPS